MYFPPKIQSNERRAFQAASAIQRVRRAIVLRQQAEASLASVVLRMSEADRRACEVANGLPPGGLDESPSFRRAFSATDIVADL